MDTKEPKKRGRKKMVEIVNQKPESSTNGTLVIESKKIDRANSENVEQKQISFGKFNITLQQQHTMSNEEIRAYYDKKFNIEDTSKSAKIITQEPIEFGIKTITEKKDQKTYKIHRVLEKFIEGTKESWPEKTDLLCWWCCHEFNTMPLPCPVKYDSIRNRYSVNGVFCSWGCVSAYSIEKYTSLGLVYQLRNRILPNLVNNDIYISPSRYCLKKFGGYMDIEQFRTLDTDIIISSESMDYVNQEIAEIKRTF